MTYDPLVAPSPSDWLAKDEDERTRLIEQYHKRARVRLQDSRLHAQFHMIVENQIAANDPIPVHTLNRLMQEGLDRHDAIHAIGSVLARQILEARQGRRTAEGMKMAYYSDLVELTVETWVGSPANDQLESTPGS